MMKYETPKWEVRIFNNQDIVTTSGLTNGFDGDGESSTLDELLGNMKAGQF